MKEVGRFFFSTSVSENSATDESLSTVSLKYDVLRKETSRNTVEMHTL